MPQSVSFIPSDASWKALFRPRSGLDRRGASFPGRCPGLLHFAPSVLSVIRRLWTLDDAGQSALRLLLWPPLPHRSSHQLTDTPKH